MPQADIAQLIIQLRADITDLKNKMGVAEKSTKGFAQRAGGALDGLKKNWLAVTAATAGFVIVARRSFQAFAQFENKMREVNTLMDLSEKQFIQMRDSVRQMTSQLPQTSQELANALYDIVSAGVEADQALAVLYRSAQAATAGVTDTQTAARAGIAAINAYSLSITELDRVYDIMFRTVKKGVLTFPDLAQNLGAILPIARAAGVSLEEVSAAMATLTKGGFPVAIAATSIRAGLTKLAAPTKEARAEMDRLGITWNGLIPTMQAIADAQLDLEGMQKVIPDIRAARGVLGLSQRMEEFKSILDEINDSSGAMGAAFSEMLKSPAVQAKLLTNAIALVRDNLILAFGPAIMSAVQELQHQFLLFAGNAEGAKASITDLSSGIRVVVGTLRIVLGIVNTIVDYVILAIEAVHRLARASFSLITGNFREAAHQMKTLGYEWVAIQEAIEKRVEDIGKTFSGAGQQKIEAPAWIKTLEQLQKQQQEGPDLTGPDLGGEGAGTGPAAALAAEMRTVASQAKVAFAELDAAYKQGLVSAEEYYGSKRAMVTAFADMEIKYLQQIYQLTEDENEKRQINAQILAKLNEAKAENVKLSQQEVEALAKQNEELAEQAAKREEILISIGQRVAGGTASLQERHEAELAALRQRQSEEIALLEEHEAAKDEIAAAHALHRIEQEQMADQQRQESLNNWLSAASAIVGQIQQIYAAAYQKEMADERNRIETILSNMRKEGASEEQIQKKKQQLEKEGYKKAKELWEKQKRANIALAIINAAQAILKGFADYGPIVGAIMAGLTAVLTGIQIAQISRQEFPGAAQGGLIRQGTTGTADDVPAYVSKGEFVAPAKSVAYYGAGVYEAMRQRRIPRGVFSGMGGLTPFSPPTKRFQEGGLVLPGAEGGDQPTVNVVNFLDDRLLEKYLDTPEGQKAVLNVIQERGYEVRQIIG